MSKRVRRMTRSEAAEASNGALTARSDASAGGLGAFSFGDPEPVLDRRLLLDVLQTLRNDRWYEPPLSLEGLARTFRSSPHHESAINLKVNQIVGSIEPTPLMSRKAMMAVAQDYLVLGNAYAQAIPNRLGGLLRVEAPRARYVRVGVVPGQYWWVPGNDAEAPLAGNVAHLFRPDLNQEIYGLPEYLGAIQAALLNENATLFRRKYYLNGSHAGYILYATGDIDHGDTEKMKAALKASKGPGNFRNLFVHAPNGKEGSIKIIPIAEAGAKDEFLNIKNVTRDDVLAAHRTPPLLLGIVPQNGSAFGKVTEACDAFHAMEIVPLLDVMLDINSELGVEVIRLRERVPMAPAPKAA